MIKALRLISAVLAQDASSQQTPPSEQQQVEKTTPEKKAPALLEQVVSEAQSLRLPENRTHIQIIAGDLFWEKDEGRARTLFAAAAAGIAEMLRSTHNNDRQFYDFIRRRTQLRQELLLAVARHDSTLAYQLLEATRQTVTLPNTRNDRRLDSETNLEQNLLAQIAATDPKVAMQNAEELLNKGQNPSSLARVLAQLQFKDKEAYTRLTEKLLNRLQAENLLANREASNLALSLLQPGPRPTDAPAGSSKVVPANPAQVLSESAFRDLLEAVLAVALKTTPAATNNLRGVSNVRGRPNTLRGEQNNASLPQNDAQNAQNNARGLLIGLQALLPQIDQYLPSRAQAVRQKISEAGIVNNLRLAFGQLNNLIQQGTTDSLLAAAVLAPPGMQSRLYQQAALKALAEGSTDRALQIANEHLDPTMRGVVQKAADFQQIARQARAEKIEEVRQTLSRLPSDEERIKLLIQLADANQKDNSKLALQFLDEARNLITRRASSYQQFEAQFQVARAFAALDPSRSFEVLEMGINQLNELLPAAALLSGFEVNIFKDGELQMQGGSMLANMVMRYGQELASLAKIDFERAQIAADKFQLLEAKILARLNIAQVVLGRPPGLPVNRGFGGRGFGQNGPFMRQGQ